MTSARRRSSLTLQHTLLTRDRVQLYEARVGACSLKTNFIHSLAPCQFVQNLSLPTRKCAIHVTSMPSVVGQVEGGGRGREREGQDRQTDRQTGTTWVVTVLMENKSIGWLGLGNKLVGGI